MQEITEGTPRVPFTVAGVLIQVPVPFVEGDILNSNEANSLNQTYRENVRNNCATKVKSIVEIAEKEERELTDEEVISCQEIIDEAIDSYVMGQRSGGGRTAMDPVLALALDITKPMVIRHHKEKHNKSQKDWNGADLRAECERVIAKNPSIIATAEKQLKVRQKEQSGIDLT